MAPGSAVAASARLKLVSLASFGLISGACFFIGYYLLRRYRKASHRKTDDSSEEGLSTASVGTPHTVRVFDQSKCREVVCTTDEQHGNEEAEPKKEENVKQEEDPVQQGNASTQHASAYGTSDAIESDQQRTCKDASTGATDSTVHERSSASAIVGDIATENEPLAETATENERRREKTEEKTVGEETGSDRQHVAAQKELLQTSRNEVKVSVNEETDKEKCTAIKATGKQSRAEKVSEIKSAESTTEKSPAADNRNETRNETRVETKPLEAAAEKEATSETTTHSYTNEAFNGTTEQQSMTPKHIKTTDVSTDKQLTSKTIESAKVIAETTPVEEVGLGREHAKSSGTSEDRERKSEFPRSGKSHLPEPARRLTDDPPSHITSQESIINRKTESNVPISSPTRTGDAKLVWSEQTAPKEIAHSEGRVVKGLNVNAASFRPHHLPHLVDETAQELSSIGKNRIDHRAEANTTADKGMDGVDGLAPSLNHTPVQHVSQTDEHRGSEHDDPSSTPVARSTKSLVPLPPLTPPPDSNRQSRRQRDRGIRGSQKTATVTPTEPATSEGVTLENQSRRSKHRWPPLEDKALDRVEVDTSSQQVSWKTNRKPSNSAQSPWSSPHASQDEPSSGQDRRQIKFDDNFVDPVSTKATSPSDKPGLIVPREVTKQSSLLNATPDCVLERKPLISEDEDDDDDADDDGEGVKKQFVMKNSTKNGNEDITKEPTGEPNSNEDTAKLVEIDQNCIGSLIELTGEKADPDVRLASLRALVNLSWTSDKHPEYPPVLDQLCANVDSDDAALKLESLRVLVNLSKNPAMVPHLLAAKAPSNLLKLLVPEISEDILINWLTILDDILWTSKELCLTFASLPTEHRAASPETLYTGLYGLKNSRILKSRIFVLSRHKSQQVTYLASRIYSCLTS